jgi:hypothetical protein
MEQNTATQQASKTDPANQIGGSLLELDTSAKPETQPITQAEKERFLKAVLTDTPYEENISLFDGQLTLTLRSMTVAQNGDIVKQISLDRDAGLAENNDAYFVTISAYRLALCLKAIDGVEFSDVAKETYKAPEDDAAMTYVKARAEKLSNWPTFKMAAFLDTFNAFESKVVKLTKAVQTQNFWKASA